MTPMHDGSPQRSGAPWTVRRVAGPIVMLIIGGAAGLLAIDLLEGPGQPVAEESASPTAVPTHSAAASDGSAPALPSMPGPSNAPQPSAAPTAAATLGPIVRWATAASFSSDGWAEEAHDAAYAAHGFIAVGYRQPLEARGQYGDYPYEARIWLSPDGTEWESLALGSEFDGARFTSVVALPDGSAAIYGFIEEPSTYESVAWRSFDGRSWSRFDLMLPSDNGLGSVVSGPRGYLSVVSYSSSETTEVGEVLHSTDGVRWESVVRFEQPDAGVRTQIRDYAAGAEGFVLTGYRYDSSLEDWVNVPFVQASGDGRAWIEADPREAPDDSSNLLVAPIGGSWAIASTDFGTNRDTLWFSSDGLRWERRTEFEVDIPDSEFEDAVAVIGDIVPAGDRLFITGGAIVCCHHPLWAAGIWSSFDAATWERLGFPADAYITSAAEHDGVIVLAGLTGASPGADWKARATFWVSERR